MTGLIRDPDDVGAESWRLLVRTQCDLDEEQAHAFCVSEQLSKLMAARTLSLLPTLA